MDTEPAASYEKWNTYSCAHAHQQGRLKLFRHKLISGMGCCGGSTPLAFVTQLRLIQASAVHAVSQQLRLTSIS